MVPAIECKFLLLVEQISVVHQHLSIVLSILIFEFLHFYFHGIILCELTKTECWIALNWHVLLKRDDVVIDYVEDFLLKGLHHWLDLINSLCQHFPLCVGFLAAHCDLLGLLESVIDLLNPIQSLVALALVQLMREHTLFHFMWVQNISAEWVFDLAAVGVDFVVCQELSWNEDFLAHFNFLLALVRVIGIFIAEYILKLLAHLLLELLGTHLFF